MTTPTGKRWLVIVQQLKVNHKKTRSFNREISEPVIISIGCVRAETDIDAYYKGCELLNEQTVEVIPLSEIEGGWRL